MEKIARNQLIKIAYENPELRETLLRIITASMEKEAFTKWQKFLAALGFGGSAAAVLAGAMSKAPDQDAAAAAAALKAAPPAIIQQVNQKKEPDAVLKFTSEVIKAPQKVKDVFIVTGEVVRDGDTKTIKDGVLPTNPEAARELKALVAQNQAEFKKDRLTYGDIFVLGLMINHTGHMGLNLAEKLKKFQTINPDFTEDQALGYVLADNFGKFKLEGITANKSSVFKVTNTKANGNLGTQHWAWVGGLNGEKPNAGGENTVPDYNPL